MPAASEWAADHIVFSSAQGALASVLYWAIAQGFWDAHRAPRLTFAGSNLDTQTLLDSFNRAGLAWGRPRTPPCLRMSATHSRVILIEPAFCDESANVMNIAAFHKAWRKALAAEPTLIILDTTLTGPLFPIGELLESFEGATAPVVVTLRSGAELDQAGLDLANVGIASIFRHKSERAKRMTSPAPAPSPRRRRRGTERRRHGSAAGAVVLERRLFPPLHGAPSSTTMPALPTIWVAAAISLPTFCTRNSRARAAAGPRRPTHCCA